MAEKRKVTINDVAKVAGVTPAIVSSVLNHDKTLVVKESTREEVMRVVELLNYTPNAMARSLRTQKSGIIGVVIVDWMNSFYGSLIRGIQDELHKNGKICFVSESQDQFDKERYLVRQFIDVQVEGMSV